MQKKDLLLIFPRKKDLIDKFFFSKNNPSIDSKGVENQWKPAP